MSAVGTAEWTSAISTAGKRPANLARSILANIPSRAGDASRRRVTEAAATRQRISLASARAFKRSVTAPSVLIPSAHARRAVMARRKGAVLNVLPKFIYQPRIAAVDWHGHEGLTCQEQNRPSTPEFGQSSLD